MEIPHGSRCSCGIIPDLYLEREGGESPTAGGCVEGLAGVLQARLALLPGGFQGPLTLLLCLPQLLLCLLGKLIHLLVMVGETFGSGKLKVGSVSSHDPMTSAIDRK